MFLYYTHAFSDITGIQFCQDYFPEFFDCVLPQIAQQAKIELGSREIKYKQR